MTAPHASTGYFRSGLPYNRLGRGPRPLVVIQGLMFENRPQPGFMVRMYAFLNGRFTTYVVLRRPGLPQGYTLRDMADDYAAMIREEFGGPVDVIGVSTGGSIAQHFAADHPDLVRRLVIHSSAYVLSDAAKRLQLRVGELAREREWTKAWSLLIGAMVPRRGVMGHLHGPTVWAGSQLMGWLAAPTDPSDLLVTIEAEDRHDFRERLAEIAAPTLVVAGAEDPFYSEALFRDTAAGIPDARLILYPAMGHPASGKQFSRDILAFLSEDVPHPRHPGP
jgi:pimeloyl-ACP methyl ester carboxylesterase